MTKENKGNKKVLNSIGLGNKFNRISLEELE